MNKQNKKNRLVHLANRFFRSFTEHPATVNETYFQHFLFALRLAVLLIAAGLAALIHAIIPALFEKTASQIVGRLHHQIEVRHQTERRTNEAAPKSAQGQSNSVSHAPQYTD